MNSEHNPDQENGSTDSLDNLLDSVRNHLGATPESAADLDEEIPLLTDVVVPATGTQPPPHNITPGSALIEPELSAPAEDPAGNEGNLSTTSTVVDEEVTDLLNETVISEVSAMQTTPAIGDDDAADPPVHLSQGDPYGETQSEDHEKAADDWLDETVLSTPIEIAGAPASDTPQNDNEQSFDINLEMAAETTRLESIDDETADPMVHLTSGSQGDPYGETQSKDHEKAADDWLDETVLSTTNEIAGPPASEPTQSPDNEQGFDIDLELAAETTRLDSLESPAVNILAPEDSRQQTVVPEPDNKAFSQIVDQDSSTGDSQTPSSQTPPSQTPSLTDSSNETYEPVHHKPVEAPIEAKPDATAGLETQRKENPEESPVPKAYQTDTVATDDLSLCLEQLEQLIDQRCSRLANELKDEVRQLFTDFPTD